MSEKRQPLPKGSALIRIAKATYGRYVLRHYQISIENKQLLDQITGPVLLLSNHTHMIDYVFISSALDFHVSWVAGAYLFKMRLLNTILRKGCWAIAKEQGKSDMSTIIQMKKATEKGRVVGLFPEGTRTWDGDTIPQKGLVLAKLVRYLKVPVLFLNLKGTYARKPRWIVNESKGPVFINLRALLKPEEYLSLPPQELENQINDLLFFSNDQWQSKAKIPYISKTPAEGLQRVLYVCPECHGIGTNSSLHDTMTCSECNTTTSVDQYGALESKQHRFKTVKQWHDWEKTQLEGPDIVFKPEKGVLLQKGDIDGYKTISKKIMVSATSKTISIQALDRDKQRFDFPIAEIASIAINAKQTAEFYLGSTLFRFRLEPNGCSLKYSELVEAQHKIQQEAQ